MRTERLASILTRSFWLDTPDGYHYCLYLFRDADQQPLYAGRSDDVVRRVREHISTRHDLVGQHIRAHRPESLDWTVDLMTVRDVGFTTLRSSRNFVDVLLGAERHIIVKHQPLLNSQKSKNSKV